MDKISVSWIILGSEDGGCLLREPNTQVLAAGSTVTQALQMMTGLDASDIAGLFAGKRVAVFGVTVQADDRLHAGDRIEVLDDLRFDPMDSRRRRAEHKARQPRSRRRNPAKS